MNVGRRDARTRIAHLLCELSLRLKLAGLGEDKRYELPMTQEQLAETTGQRLFTSTGPCVSWKRMA